MILRPYLFATASLVFIFSTAAQADELIRQGDFGSLSAWNPASDNVIPTLEQKNSSFESTYPNNNSSVLLKGTVTVPSATISQKVDTIYGGKAKLELDFYPQENPSQTTSGCKIMLAGGEKHEFPMAGVLIFPNNQITLRQPGKQGKVLLRDKFHPGQWYHFTAIIDIDTKTWSGEITGENGETETFTDQEMDPGSVELSAIVIGSFGKIGPEERPILFDNISLKELP